MTAKNGGYCKGICEGFGITEEHLRKYKPSIRDPTTMIKQDTAEYRKLKSELRLLMEKV